MEFNKNNPKSWSISHKYVIKSWPKNNWVDDWSDADFEKLLNDMTTELTIHRQDLEESRLADSKNADAIAMLNSIGIKC
jgi:hypothetical protein